MFDVKKIMGNLGTKIAAIVLSFVFAGLTAVSAVAVVYMIDHGFYTKTYEYSRSDSLRDMAVTDAWNIYNDYYHIQGDVHWGELPYYVSENLFVTITLNDGTEIINTYKGQKTAAEVKLEDIDYYRYQVIYDDEGAEIREPTEAGTLSISLYVADEMTGSDKYTRAAWLIDLCYSVRYHIIAAAVIFIILFIAVISYLYCAVGHRSDGTVQLNHFDRIPFDLVTAAGVIIVALCFVGISDLLYYRLHIETVIAACFAVSAAYFTALAYTLTFAARIKTGTLLKNNVIYKVFIWLWRVLKKAGRAVKNLFANISLVKKASLIVGVALFMEMLVFIISLGVGSVFIALWWLLVSVLLGACVIYVSATMKKIKLGGERIAAGDLNYKIDNRKMHGEFREFSESLNNIGNGLQNAVEEKMKSERFKTELITNVSHDIKTPLTSIINYVDLIKKEPLDNENVIKYIEVLDRQSIRLKKLIEDLVEASKASTGNLQVNLTECEVGVLLSQTVGEFDERLSKNDIKAVLNTADKPIKIMADGRHLWRVFDNLMSNVCKYSLPGTRVYMDVKESGKKAVITFRNISKYELNVSADELMERFVRGDTSRNTEGSGLGLSIAKSLVELQNGNMELEVDGDLFKVILTFDIV